tara:strand:+ start:515 stop:682 length:168 start_codon:yes stop_codon:yes gene_type:complete
MAEIQESGDSELDAIAEDIIEMSDDFETFFRDPSGIILPNNFWYPCLYWMAEWYY